MRVAKPSTIFKQKKWLKANGYWQPSLLGELEDIQHCSAAGAIILSREKARDWIIKNHQTEDKDAYNAREKLPGWEENDRKYELLIYRLARMIEEEIENTSRKLTVPVMLTQEQRKYRMVTDIVEKEVGNTAHRLTPASMLALINTWNSTRGQRKYKILKALREAEEGLF